METNVCALSSPTPPIVVLISRVCVCCLFLTLFACVLDLQPQAASWLTEAASHIPHRI